MQLARAWRRAYQNPNIHRQITGMLAQLILMIENEDRGELPESHQLVLDEHI